MCYKMYLVCSWQREATTITIIVVINHQMDISPEGLSFDLSVTVCSSLLIPTHLYLSKCLLHHSTIYNGQWSSKHSTGLHHTVWSGVTQVNSFIALCWWFHSELGIFLEELSMTSHSNYDYFLSKKSSNFSWIIQKWLFRAIRWGWKRISQNNL